MEYKNLNNVATNSGSYYFNKNNNNLHTISNIMCNPNKINIYLSIINMILSVSIIAIVACELLPFINNVDQVNLSKLETFIDQTSNITNTPDYKKIMNIINILDEIKLNNINNYIYDLQEIINFSCAVLPINCTSII